MEYFLTFLGLLFSVIFYAYKLIIQEKSIKLLVAPEPSGALPFIGHLHRLQGQQAHPTRVLGNMADTYGQAFSLRLGSRRALVVSSWQMVKECFTINERNFATRPSYLAMGRYLNYNNAGFGITPYGPYLREIRKLVVSELFTSQRVESFKNIRNSEVKSSINELWLLSQKNGGNACVTNMHKWFDHIAFNIIIRILAGKRFSDDEEDSHVKEAINRLLYLSGVFVVSDYFRGVEWMDVGGHLNAMKEVSKELDGVVEKWVKEHIKRREDQNGEDYKDGDFMDVMLSAIPRDAELFGYGGETVIKATSAVLMWSGSESTALTMTWTLSLLLNHPNILNAAKKELDIHVGREKLVEESDIKNLVYLQAIVKETLRMYPPAPLGGAHEAIDDRYINGYHVTKGTRLIVNVWKLHRDPQVWSDPHVFRPERFLEEHSNTNFHGQNFEYIPFSTGRRMCPATVYVSHVLHLTLARLLQGFDLSTTTGKHVDMTEGLGLTLPKVNPLEVIITPRLSPELYQITSSNLDE